VLIVNLFGSLGTRYSVSFPWNLICIFSILAANEGDVDKVVQVV